MKIFQMVDNIVIEYDLNPSFIIHTSLLLEHLFYTFSWRRLLGDTDRVPSKQLELPAVHDVTGRHSDT